jgi:hypothetical protein
MRRPISMRMSASTMPPITITSLDKTPFTQATS